MNQELYLGSRTAEDEQGRQHCFHYFLLVGEIAVGQFFCESYGVKVAQEGGGNQCAIPNLTTSAARIDDLAEQLLVYCVTPVNLPDVVADWL